MPTTNESQGKGLPVLSIVTISWNQMDDIVEYLDAMEKTRKSCRFPIEMVLVDNGSRDGTPELVEKDYPWVKLVRNEKNEGFAEGCNVGLRVTTGDFVMLLNPDAHANVQALEGMVLFLQRHEDVGMVGCKLMHEDGLPQQSSFAEMSPISYFTNHSILYPISERIKKFLYGTGLRRRTKPYSCGWIQGSCMIVPRHVFDKIGELEKSFFIYCEDTDWCHRVRKAGYKVVHMPNLEMFHRQKGSVNRRPEYFFRRVYRSVVHYTNRQFDEPARTRILNAVWLDMQLRRVIYRLLAIIKPSRREHLAERLKSVDALIAIVNTRNPDLFDDPPPR